MLPYIISFFILLISLHYIFNCNYKARLLRKIPAPDFYFIVGNALCIMVSPVELFRLGRKWASYFKGIYSLYLFPLGTINIYNPEDIEIVTSSMKYHNKSVIYDLLKPWLQEGLLVSNGPKWQQRRKILTPAFHFDVLRKYYTIIEEHDQLLIETLKKSNDEAINIIPLVSDYTLNIICETAMGTKLHEHRSGAGNEYKESLYSVAETLVYRLANIFLFKPDIIFNLVPMGRKQKKHLSVVHNFTKNVIEKRKEDLKNKKIESDYDKSGRKRRCAMLDLLISAEKEGLIDSKDIQEEVDTFMFEGHDTTAAGLIFCLLSIANDQIVQDKIVAELRSIFGEDSRTESIEDLSLMRYLDCCIKESLRLYPPVPFIGRLLLEEITLSNYTIPANTLCHIHIYDLHRREDLFPNAEKFDPDRFLPENSVGRHNYAYIPFSAGPRNCIGQKFALMEMKSIISSILRNFKLVPVTKPTDLCFTADLVLRNTGPIYVKFIQRKNDLLKDGS